MGPLFCYRSFLTQMETVTHERQLRRVDSLQFQMDGTSLNLAIKHQSIGIGQRKSQYSRRLAMWRRPKAA